MYGINSINRKYINQSENENGLLGKQMIFYSFPHLSNGVAHLSGPHNHLHLKHVAFGHTPGHELLQNTLTVQPEWELGGRAGG